MYKSSAITKCGGTAYICNCCKKPVYAFNAVGSGLLCACNECVPKIAKKFFNGDCKKTMSFIKITAYQRQIENDEEKEEIHAIKL